MSLLVTRKMKLARKSILDGTRLTSPADVTGVNIAGASMSDS